VIEDDEVGIADDPEIDVLPTEDFELGVIPTLINSTTHPAFLRVSPHAVILVVFHISVRICVFCGRLQKSIEIWRFGVHQLMFPAACIHGDVADSSVVELVESDVENGKYCEPKGNGYDR
jgi:hypothetical protein